ncbi:MAG: NAD(P)/FAD-dependent oxidoreductase [Hyphomicrobiaceae bacterium]|nr:NAD(P)/FAD-dependent oxidoreductase [Hyphomicrobiaceae bacterium]
MGTTFPDVLVVGLGPAGASAAASAARAGARVHAIDRKHEAGKPVQCAEFVPAMMGQQTRALNEATRQPISEMTTFVAQDKYSEPNFIGHMIDRAAFDAALVAEAEANGAVCAFGISLRTISADGSVTLCDGTTHNPRVIIAADGPRSPTGRAVGRVNREIAETRQITVPLLETLQSTDIFLAPDYPGGYAWLFPKGAVANLGLGVDEQCRHQLKQLLADLHARLVAEGRVGADILRHTGGAIPVGGCLDPVVEHGNVTVLLAGDAAGLTNPITGAGINSAVQSGTLAGRAAAKVAAGNHLAATEYRDDLEDLFGASLERAVERRRTLLQKSATGIEPTITDLKRAWIAFPEYWAA